MGITYGGCVCKEIPKERVVQKQWDVWDSIHISHFIPNNSIVKWSNTVVCVWFICIAKQSNDNFWTGIKNGRVFYAFLVYHHMMKVAQKTSPMSKRYFILRSINRFSNNGIAIIDALEYRWVKLSPVDSYNSERYHFSRKEENWGANYLWTLFGILICGSFPGGTRILLWS